MRVLQVFGEPLSFGGQEAFVMNMYECIDKSKIQFDFFTPYYCDNAEMKKRINILGGNVYTGNKEFNTKKRKIYYISELRKFLKDNKYEIIHINSGSTFSLAYGSKIAKRNGVKRVIVHSHSQGIINFKHRIISRLSRKKYKKYTDVYIACSEEAAMGKFPKDIVREKRYMIIKNGINLDKYRFNKQIRKKYRNELNYTSEDFVVGHVGRMEKEKNHFFILDVFKQLLKNEPKARLLLIGTGSLKASIKSKIQEDKIQDKVTILENRSDVNNILQAMDVFILPSLYEGLPIATIEAQATGMKVYVSENITDATKVTDNLIKFELSKGSEYWANQILCNYLHNYVRDDLTMQINQKGWDAQESAKKLEKIYISKGGKI